MTVLNAQRLFPTIRLPRLTWARTRPADERGPKAAGQRLTAERREMLTRLICAGGCTSESDAAEMMALFPRDF